MITSGRAWPRSRSSWAALGLQVQTRQLTTGDLPAGQVIAVVPSGALLPGTAVTVTAAAAPPVVAPAPAAIFEVAAVPLAGRPGETAGGRRQEEARSRPRQGPLSRHRAGAERSGQAACRTSLGGSRAVSR